MHHWCHEHPPPGSLGCSFYSAIVHPVVPLGAPVVPSSLASVQAGLEKYSAVCVQVGPSTARNRQRCETPVRRGATNRDMNVKMLCMDMFDSAGLCEPQIRSLAVRSSNYNKWWHFAVHCHIVQGVGRRCRLGCKRTSQCMHMYLHM